MNQPIGTHEPFEQIKYQCTRKQKKILRRINIGNVKILYYSNNITIILVEQKDDIEQIRVKIANLRHRQSYREQL